MVNVQNNVFFFCGSISTIAWAQIIIELNFKIFVDFNSAQNIAFHNAIFNDVRIYTKFEERVNLKKKKKN